MRLRMRTVVSVRTIPSISSLQTTMTNFPRREKPASQVGPRIDIAPNGVRDLMNNKHGLSSLLMNHESWESFSWKGNDLSAPMRALWSAESKGLYPGNGARAQHIAIADITADINSYLGELGKSLVSENAVLNSLRSASRYLQAAIGVSIVINRAAQTVHFVDGIDNAENIEKYLTQLKAKHTKVAQELDHAVACGYDIAPILAAAEASTGLKVLPAGASV